MNISVSRILLFLIFYISVHYVYQWQLQMFYNTNILCLSQLNIFNDPRDCGFCVFYFWDSIFPYAPFVCSWVKVLITICLLSSSIVLKMYSSKIKVCKKTDCKGNNHFSSAVNQGLMNATYFRYKRGDDRVNSNFKKHLIFGFLQPRSHL